jgi:hypothetical protein
MSKKEEREKARALAEIERKFNAPEYKGERLFAFLGICCASLIIANVIIQVYSITQTVSSYGKQYTYIDRIRDASSVGGFNPLSTFAPFFWALSAM